MKYTTQKEFKELIAKRLGWDSYGDMMFRSDAMEIELKKAINWICEFYDIDLIFEGV